MLETVLWGTGVAVCVALLLRDLLPAPTRARLDGRASHAWQALRAGMPRRTRAPRATRRAPQEKADVNTRQAQREAELEARDVIDRVRRQVRDGSSTKRDGNVYRPDAFKSRPPEQDKPH